MLSPVPYSLLKMHWSPEHAAGLSQWPEQHLDVSSTTSPPSGHKHDPYSAAAAAAAAAARRGAGYPSSAGGGYPWASDDISALTASSLLKRYAEKYSGLELPYERPAVSGAYSEPGTFLKSESEPWGLSQGMDCYPGLEALAAGAKVGPGGVTLVTSDPAGYGGGGAGSCSAPPPQDYPPAYNSTYLSSGYCPQPSPALPPGAPLHSLQATPTLVPSYNPASPVYNYPAGCYAHPQTSLASGYSHPHSASYLPSGLGAAAPLAPRPTVGYGYLGGGVDGAGGPLKRKAFEMAGEEEGGDEGAGGGEGDAAAAAAARYRKYGNGHGKSHGNSHGNNGYDLSAPADGHAYKPGKLVSPPYGGGEYSPPPDPPAVGDQQGFPHQQRLSVKMPAARARSEDPTGGR